MADLIAEADAREAAAKAARVKAHTAKVEAEAARARESMKAAVKKKGKPIKDADIEKMKQSMGTAAKKPKGQLGKKAQAAKKADITNPTEKPRAYDFEKASKAKGGIDVTADTKALGINSATKPVAPPAASKAVAAVTDETPTQGFKQPNVKPAKTIAQEVAEVKSNIPMKPLEGQGSMADKPVAKVIDKRGAHIARKPGGTPPAGIAERRVPAAQAVQTPKAAPAVQIGGGKAITPSGTITGPPKVAPAAVSSPTAGTTPKMTAEDLFGTPEKPPIPKMTAADLFGSPNASYATKAKNYLKGMPADVAKTSWKTAKGIARGLDPTREYRALGAGRTSLDVAKAGLKGSFRVVKGTVKGIGAGIAADYAGQMGYKLGGAINKGPGQSPDETFNPFTASYHVTKAAMSAFDNEGELARLRAQGRKAGVKVSGGDSGFSAIGKGLLGAVTLGRVDPRNEIKVTEAPGAKSLRAKRLAAGEAKFHANKAKTAPKAEGFSEADYQKLKQTASRNVIKGSYRG